MRTALTVAVSFIFLIPHAQAGSSLKKATAVRTSEAPQIDGILREAAWQGALPLRDFVQLEPLEGTDPTQATEVRILYDDEALYIGFTLFDTEPQNIVARLARRDDEVESDFVSVRIDSYHDHQTAFEFTVNAAGVKADILQYNDAREEDPSWDVVWDAETAMTPEGWIVEIKIPFKVLRFSEESAQEWGIQFIRYISRNRERQQWVLIRKSESGFVSRFGHLVGLENLTRPGQVELLPYIVGGNRFLPKSPSYPKGTDFTSNIGLDAKFKPSSGLTIDATFNPDFGQVEADPAVLNLSTYETFYPEKRPFFIEGSQILRFTTFGGDFGPGLFYSRRIGRAIRARPPERGHVENEPQFATILGAAKISGKTAEGLSIGVLEAVTAEERATFVDSVGQRTVQVVEPLTNYALIRIRKDVLENSNAGVMLTSVNRKGRVPAGTAGVDWNLKFLESLYRIDGFLATSRTSLGGGPGIEGSAGRISFNKDGGPHWRGFLSADFTSKKFNINDMGFFRRPNDFGFVGQLLYRDDQVRSWERIYNLSLNYHKRLNFDGAEIINSAELSGYVQFLNYWEVRLTGSADYGKYDDRETRGNGLFRKSSSRNLRLSIETDPRQIVVGDLALNVGGDSRGATTSGAELELEIRPASSVTLELSVENDRRRRQLAWVENVVDLAVSPNPISVFAERTTNEWDLTTRGSFVFARDLTLQLYVQLFVAKGTYGHTIRMTAPDQFLPYAYDAPDFSSLALNSNVVLRWEYLPGSTLYLVWSQSREGDGGSYQTPVGNEFNNLFSLPMTNVILLKISYWLNF